MLNFAKEKIMKTDILALNTHSYLSRDTEAFLPVFNYLRLHGINIKHGPIYNGYYLILKHRPSVVFLDCIIGGRWHAEMALFAKKMGCKVVSLIGEGASFDWAKQDPKLMWGWLHEQKVIWDAFFFWNQPTKDLFTSYFPSANKKIYTVGATGYDRYKFAHPKQLPRSGEYSATVGVGCWVFSLPANDSWVNINRQFFSENLQKIVQKNRNILFYIKLHPGANDDLFLSGVEKCRFEKNVVILPAKTPIIDCIASSDIWLTFESNTALEAWLMKKQTALLNPAGIQFPYERLPFSKGQPNFSNADQWTEALQTFLRTRILPGYYELEKIRQHCTTQIIGHADGLNHVRTGNVILDILNAPDKTIIDSPRFSWFKNTINSYLRWNFGKYHKLLPKCFSWTSAFENFYFDHRKNYSEVEFNQNACLRMQEQMMFYKQNNYSLKFLRAVY